MQKTTLTLTVAFATAIFSAATASAQNPEMQQKIADIKAAMAANKQMLAQYTWQEVESISVKGSVKDTKTYQVHLGPDGKAQKTLLGDQKAQSGGGREGRLKKHMIEHATEEYQQYGQAIGALAKQYSTPNPEAIEQAKAQGNISLQPGAGTISLIIKGYVKPNDSVTFTLNEQTKSPMSVTVNSYLDDPSDAVNISAQYSKLPDGTNHVSSTTINGVKKELVVNEQNSNYQHI
jgi:hypothetical protein